MGRLNFKFTHFLYAWLFLAAITHLLYILKSPLNLSQASLKVLLGSVLVSSLPVYSLGFLSLKGLAVLDWARGEE